MIHAAVLLASGVAMMLWRPCRSREARAPRAAVALLLLAPLAVWVGSFGLAVGIASGELGAPLSACGVLWRQLLAGELSWWRALPLAVWALAFPLRSLVAVWLEHRRATLLLPTLAVAGQPLSAAGTSKTPILVVPALGTPGLTLGLATPTVLLDEGFWAAADPVERSVVLRHELAHARGRHGVLEAGARLLTAPIAPLRAADDVYDCVRRHLEALADDAAVRTHGRQTVGRALGRIALAGFPVTGLGATGACLWRVQRLVAPTAAPPWKDRAVLLVVAFVMATGLVSVAADAATALGPVTAADFCPVTIT